MTPNAQHPPAGGDPNSPAPAGSTTVVAGRDLVGEAREAGAEESAALATIRAMKAAVHTRYGRPEVVRISEVAWPTLEDDEVLVNVHATTVNRTDCGFRSGRPLIARLAISVFTAAGASGPL